MLWHRSFLSALQVELFRRLLRAAGHVLSDSVQPLFYDTSWVVWCDGCKSRRACFCEDCAFHGHMYMCERNGCFKMFCSDCADSNINIVADDADELRQLCITCCREETPAVTELRTTLRHYEYSDTSGGSDEEESSEDDESSDDDDEEAAS